MKGSVLAVSDTILETSKFWFVINNWLFWQLWR